MTSRKEKRRGSGYAVMARIYRDRMERGPQGSDAREALARKIDALETIAAADTGTIYALYDTGAFNDITRGYIELALDAAGVNEKTRGDVLDALRAIYDTTDAGQAELYHMEN